MWKPNLGIAGEHRGARAYVSMRVPGGGPERSTRGGLLCGLIGTQESAFEPQAL